ncbi:MAG: class III signal peptide-containing protein [Candidatus Diapherotrites archaeon]|nr:class III signal peptide-containing protein [Candidatus Diapherotrites archaeon]
MDNKAQGALEYLLLIGGAVLVAVIVIALMSGMGQQGSQVGVEGNKKINEIADVINGTSVKP